MIDPTRFPMPPASIVAMANRLADARKQTELPHVEPFRALAKLDRTDDLVAAALAGGMIAAGGKAVSAEEAVGVYQAVREALR